MLYWEYVRTLFEKSRIEKMSKNGHFGVRFAKMCFYFFATHRITKGGIQ